MTVLEIPHLRRNDPQLLCKISQDIGLDIIPPGRKSRPFSKEAQLKRKPDPARTIDRLDQTDVIKGQAPNLDKRPFQFATPATKPEIANRSQTQPSIASPFANCSSKRSNMHARACWAKMANATSSHDFFQLSRLSRWHVESEALDHALERVIEEQAQVPMAKYWGTGRTASSDGQFFPTTRQGEAMNLINAKYGSEPGLKAYTLVSDQFGPFATQVIPATVNEAPYILDGLLLNEAGKKAREQYADTGGFTDLVFATTSLLGYLFRPRIRDLTSKKLHVFDRKAVPKDLNGLTGDRIRENTIIANWPDILRSIATMISGRIRPSQFLKALAARPRQHDLAIALREIGRIERTLFIIEWVLDIEMQRRANVGLTRAKLTTP